MIRTHDLMKIYSSGKGIFNVTFEVAKGEVFGFLGPNGAGKTTTIRVLLGFTNPTGGACTIKGLDCRVRAAKIQENLGYVPGEIAFPEGMTGRQFLEFMTGMRRTKNGNLQDKLIEEFELEVSFPIHKMSKGMKQKLALICAFMHDPEILILDEPTSGLDPLMHRRFVNLILTEKARGKTILLSSHRFDEIESTCERVAVMREGRIVAVEDISTLKASQRKGYLVTVGGEKDIVRVQKSGLECTVVASNQVEITIGDDYPKMMQTLAECRVTGLDVTTQTLEDTFISYYGKGRGEEDPSVVVTL